MRKNPENFLSEIMPFIHVTGQETIHNFSLENSAQALQSEGHYTFFPEMPLETQIETALTDMTTTLGVSLVTSYDPPLIGLVNDMRQVGFTEFMKFNTDQGLGIIAQKGKEN